MTQNWQGVSPSYPGKALSRPSQIKMPWLIPLGQFSLGYMWSAWAWLLSEDQGNAPFLALSRLSHVCTFPLVSESENPIEWLARLETQVWVEWNVRTGTLLCVVIRQPSGQAIQGNTVTTVSSNYPADQVSNVTIERLLPSWLQQCE